MASYDRQHLRNQGIPGKTVNHPIDWNVYITIAIEDLDRAGVQYADLSEEIKKEATKLEHNMTLFAMYDDLPSFISAVREWRDLMINDWQKKDDRP